MSPERPRIKCDPHNCDHKRPHYCDACLPGGETVWIEKKDDPALPGSRAVLEETIHTICGDRQASYGHPRPGFEQIAKVWSALTGHDIDARMVCRMMVGLKLCRDTVSIKKDNVVDAIGYAALMEEL